MACNVFPRIPRINTPNMWGLKRCSLAFHFPHFTFLRSHSRVRTQLRVLHTNSTTFTIRVQIKQKVCNCVLLNSGMNSNSMEWIPALLDARSCLLCKPTTRHYKRTRVSFIIVAVQNVLFNVIEALRCLGCRVLNMRKSSMFYYSYLLMRSYNTTKLH